MADILVNTPTIAGRRDWLRQCVESVAAQTVAPLEHRVELDEWELGAWAMHNRLAAAGLAEHGGPRDDLWLLNLDDDNALAPDYLEVMGAAADEADPTVAVVYSWPAVTPHPGTRVPVHSLLVRSTAWVEAGGLPTDVAFGDWSLWLDLLDAGWRFSCVPRRLWYYRVHDDQLSHRNNRAVATGELTATRHHRRATV
jgi:hypothetical protein